MMLSNLESEATAIANDKFIEEISIVIAAQDLTPTMMSQDFLKFSGIIPKEWELSQQPVLNPNYAQLNFTNGIGINAQPRTITISESLGDKNLSEVISPQIAAKYIEKLSHAEYMGLSFSPKILVPYPEQPAQVRQFITGKLLGNGAWKEIGNVPMQAGINLMYGLERCQLTISISEARLQQPQQAPIFAILFSGSFNYTLNPEETPAQRLPKLSQMLNYWHTDLQAFREIVEHRFLNNNSPANSSGNSSYEDGVFPGQLL